MVQRLLERLRSRFVFVVGKGGVGKTTTAGALALALAEGGERVHLLSTDPAHSVADLFETTLPPGDARPSPCTPHLLLEELDAEGRWSAWREWARGPLADLVDRGTYLDREDVEAFLDLSLPGVDEVAALLRLTDLEGGDAQRIVVDTAPTGHTLRLLATGGVIRGWVEAFDAMDAKARAVVEGLTHRAVRLPSADVVDDLHERADRFEAAIVGGGDAVVVERPEAPVQAESARLRLALEELGLRVAARVAVGGGNGDVLAVPRARGLVGCAGLARWGAPADGGGEMAGPAPSPSPAPPSGASPRPEVLALLEALPRDLVLFVGKGGVGKTTCAAACALALAGHRDVELLGVDPAGSLADVLGLPVEAEGTEVAPGLVARQLDADRAFADFRESYRDEVEEAFRRVGLDRSATLDRRVVTSLLELAPPGVDELLAVSALLEASDPGTTRLVDTAPTGHLLRLLETPERALAWVHQLIRVLLKYRAAVGLDALAERLLDFSKRLKHLNLRFKDPRRSGAVMVTLPGPLDRAEAGRLLQRLEALGVAVAATIENRRTGGEGPGSPDPGPPDAGAPVVLAPERDASPEGPQALSAFLATWTTV